MTTFLRRYWQWILLLGLVNVSAWYTFERLHSRELDIRDLWPIRMYLVSGLLLFDNLCVLWWYAHLTREVAEAASEQAKAAKRQSEVSEEQFALTKAQVVAAEDRLKRSELPCVVIEWHRLEPRGPASEAWTYMARNLGPGTAINIVYVEDLAADRLTPTYIGALAPGQEIEVPAPLRSTLRTEETGTSRKRHVILAQPLAGDLWVVSGNLMHAERRLFHRVQTVTLNETQRTQIDRQTAEEYIHEHWDELRRELNAMLESLRQT